MRRLMRLSSVRATVALRSFTDTPVASPGAPRPSAVSRKSSAPTFTPSDHKAATERHARAVNDLVAAGRPFSEVLAYASKHAHVLHSGTFVAVFQRAQYVEPGTGAVTPTEYEHFMRVCTSARSAMHSMSDAGIVDVMMGLAAQGVRPPVSAMQRWSAVVSTRLETFAPATLAHSATALSQLRLGPTDMGEVFYEKFLSVVASRAKDFSSQQLLDLITALATLLAKSNVKIPREFFESFCAAAKDTLRARDRAPVCAALESMGWTDVAALRTRALVDDKASVVDLVDATDAGDARACVALFAHCAHAPLVAIDGESRDALTGLCDAIAARPDTLATMAGNELTFAMEALLRFQCAPSAAFLAQWRDAMATKLPVLVRSLPPLLAAALSQGLRDAFGQPLLDALCDARLDVNALSVIELAHVGKHLGKLHPLTVNREFLTKWMECVNARHYEYGRARPLVGDMIAAARVLKLEPAQAICMLDPALSSFDNIQQNRSMGSVVDTREKVAVAADADAAKTMFKPLAPARPAKDLAHKMKSKAKNAKPMEKKKEEETKTARDDARAHPAVLNELHTARSVRDVLAVAQRNGATMDASTRMAVFEHAQRLGNASHYTLRKEDRVLLADLVVALVAEMPPAVGARQLTPLLRGIRMCKLLVPAETYQQWNAAFQRMGDVFDAFELCEMVSHMPVDCVRRLPDFLPTWAARVHPRFATLEIYHLMRVLRELGRVDASLSVGVDFWRAWRTSAAAQLSNVPTKALGRFAAAFESPVNHTALMVEQLGGNDFFFAIMRAMHSKLLLFNERELASLLNLLSKCNRLGLSVPDGLAADLLRAFTPHLVTYEWPGVLSTSMKVASSFELSCSVLGGSLFFEQWVKAITPHMPKLRITEFVSVVYALGTMPTSALQFTGLRPADLRAFLDLMVSLALPRLAEMHEGQLCHVLYGVCHVLGPDDVRPSDVAFARAWRDAIRRHFGAMQGPQIANVLYAASRVNFHIAAWDDAFMMELYTLAYELMSDMKDLTLVKLLYAMRRLDVVPDSLAHLRFFEHFESLILPHMGKLPMSKVMDLALSVAEMRLPLSDAFYAELRRVCVSGSDKSTHDDIGALLWSWTLLDSRGIAADREWIASRVAAASLQQFPYRTRFRLANIVAWFGLEGPWTGWRDLSLETRPSRAVLARLQSALPEGLASEPMYCVPDSAVVVDLFIAEANVALFVDPPVRYAGKELRVVMAFRQKLIERSGMTVVRVREQTLTNMSDSDLEDFVSKLLRDAHARLAAKKKKK